MQRLMKCVQLIQIWEGLRRPGAELQKKGTNSLTITGAMCMYTVESTYAGGRGLPSESDEQKAKHFDEGPLRVRAWDKVSNRGCGGRTMGERKTAVISCAKIDPHGILSTMATQSSPQLPRPKATRTTLLNGNGILLETM